MIFAEQVDSEASLGKALAILALIADGRFHSGESIAQNLGLSRAAVWKQIRILLSQGFRVDAVRGKGYRLAGGFDVIRPEQLTDCLASRGVDLAHLEYHWLLDSTNTHIRENYAYQSLPVAVIAERQTSGRGRRGKAWISSSPGNLLFSLGHWLDVAPAALSGLSLVAGLAIVESMRKQSLPVSLKWPNDLILDDRKLGGILLEVSAESGGPTRVITGVGLNLRSVAVDPGLVDQPWISLDEFPQAHPLRRDSLLCDLISNLHRDYQAFLIGGFPQFQERWREVDYLYGRTVQVHTGKQTRVGIACGATPSGDLRVDFGGTVEAVNAGEVSVRRQA